MDPSTSDDIQLCIVSQDGREVQIRNKRNAPLLKVFQKYCNRYQLDYKTIHFTYNGNRITGRTTPAMVHMSENDEIEAFMMQTGGGVKGL